MIKFDLAGCDGYILDKRTVWRYFLWGYFYNYEVPIAYKRSDSKLSAILYY